MRCHRTFGPPPASLDMGGAPPHTDNRIRQAARGEGQVGLLKNNAPVANRSLELSLERGVALEHLLNSARNFSACSRSHLNSGLDTD